MMRRLTDLLLVLLLIAALALSFLFDTGPEDFHG